jgi:adenylosuccinate lyase
MTERTDLSTLTPSIALGALDGRYRSAIAPLVDHLSEAALNRARLQVEVEWLIHLCDSHALPGAPELTDAERAYLRDVVATFGADEVAEHAAIEAETRHDVKAVEYLLKRRLESAGDVLGEGTSLPGAHEIVHIFCTSEDINNLSYALTVRSAVVDVWLPAARGLVADLAAQAAENAQVLTFNPLTTQIEAHDWQAELYADVARFNRILHNLATDVWTYISLGYFVQNLAAQGSTGSSTMPHKVNPIRFENAEANLEISTALLDTLASTLVTSRLQRDLTDSSTQRNIGTAFGHSLLAIDNVRRGLAGLDVNAEAMARDLDGNWEVLGEAVQQAMRAASIAGATGMEDPYERLKELTRGRKVDGEAMRGFIGSLGLPADVEARLLSLTPATYVGLSAELARQHAQA